MIHALTIINKGDEVPDGTLELYCGRGSPLGNPHVMQGTSKKERDRVCDAYEADFPTPAQKEECEWIAKMLKTRPVALQCFCVPKRCHCETPRNYIVKHLLPDL